eukprot:TRINITY_DN4333_c0_g2_i11.p1 TRINITY_DN4333_c0_g2~~TRINITY_DN4333_c0_g2_i11.p1  ORF type:complete len:696 (-),score=204.09 TRINITY_DN4333_c0_g2_i11:1180-3267(-)
MLNQLTNMHTHSIPDRSRSLMEEEKPLHSRGSDDSKEMNVEDDDLDCPNPEIHTLQKSQASFVPAECMQSQSDRRELLREVFVSYAEVLGESGDSVMKGRQYLKVLQDAKIVGVVVAKSEADIIYMSYTKGKRGFMNCETFLRSLVKVAEIVYPTLAGQSKSKALEKLIAQHFLPLRENSPSPNKYAELFASIVYDENTKELLISILPILKDVYDVYFGNPFKAAKDFKQVVKVSTKQLLVFLREFNLIQNFSNKSLALSALEQLVRTPDELLTNSEETKAIFDEPGQDYGCYFTLGRFFVLLLWLAVTAFDAIRPDFSQYTGTEKLFFLLAKMELSPGFANLYKAIPKNTSVQFTLVPPLEVLARVVQNNPLNESEKEECVESEEGECKEKLKKLFVWYCSESNAMTVFRYLSLLKNAHVPVSSTDAELIFMKVLGDAKPKKSRVDNVFGVSKSPKVSKQSKMDFDKFYHAMSLIAKKVYPELPMHNALSELVSKEMRVIEERNKYIGADSEYLKESMEQLNQQETRDLLRSVHRLLKPYFDAYTEGTGLMKHESFLKFARDFSVFPDLCTKLMLHGNFHVVANNLLQNEETIQKEHLTADDFVKALALCAIQSKAFDKDNDPIERILSMLEKIVQSAGARKQRIAISKIKSPLNDIDPLMPLRKKYKSYFDTKSMGSTKKVVDEVLGEDNEWV